MDGMDSIFSMEFFKLSVYRKLFQVMILMISTSVKASSMRLF